MIRVGPQHARKFAAKLAAMNVPYLYYEVIEGGHGAGSTLAEKAAMRAARIHLLFAPTGLPGVSPLTLPSSVSTIS